ncbi:aspartate aminotransferase family protein [Deinococcus yavapaiensis]|nr:aminotransferase class III-fold pyridoxal phosphate-dependent enzyme [Deinococcus yavapaiensis]
MTADEAVRLEVTHGNGKLMRGLDILGMSGPLRPITPWELEDPHGRHVINASGYAALPFGDNPPELVGFLRDMLAVGGQIAIAQQSVTTWRAALEANLVRLLSHQAPSHADSRVFFSNSGTEAVEAAIKFAVAARPKAKYLINFQRAYHGKTFMSLSLTPNPTLQGPFRNLLSSSVVTLPFGDIEALARTVKRLGPDKIVAVVLEPILGEAGVRLPPPDFLRAVHDLCRPKGVLLVVDEIQTGLGRSGHWFQSLAAGLEPDIITLAKPLGGGLVPVGATIVRNSIYRELLGDVNKLKRHSNTFGGNSIAMAVGLKSLEMLIDMDAPARSRALGERGLTRLKAVQQRFPNLLEDVRGAGTLFAMNFRPVIDPKFLPGQADFVSEVSGFLALLAFYRAGVQLNFSLNAARTMRITPAMNMPDDVFDELFDRVGRAAEQHPTSFSLVRGTGLGKLLQLAKFAFFE